MKMFYDKWYKVESAIDPLRLPFYPFKQIKLYDRNAFK